jgi:hypothetical protein
LAEKAQLAKRELEFQKAEELRFNEYWDKLEADKEKYSRTAEGKRKAEQNRIAAIRFNQRNNDDRNTSSSEDESFDGFRVTEWGSPIYQSKYY